jgi:protein-disulfide isomerase
MNSTNRRALKIGAGLAATLLVAGCGRGDNTEAQGNFSSNPDTAKIEKIVRDYIMAHPDLVEEAKLARAESEAAKAIGERRKDIETPFGSAWAGNVNGDVTLVEFYDYACGYCRASNADIDRLLAEDKQLKVVWREYPVLGPDSLDAARMSLAAAEQGKFLAFHKQQFAVGRPAPESIERARAASGVARLVSPSFDAELAQNEELGRLIGAQGTPTFVVGDRILHGAVGYDELKKAIADARKKA